MANGRLMGVYRGVVVNSGDPMKSGRVQVQVPAAGVPATWAPVCVSGAPGGPSVGPGTQVVVGFENGDAAYPIVLGRLP